MSSPDTAPAASPATSQNATRPLALTPGEPAGIGPDLCIQLAQQARRIPVVAVASSRLLRQRAEQLGLPLTITPYHGGDASCRAGEISLQEVALPGSAAPGVLDVANAGYVLETIRNATEGCLSGRFAALVTGPIHKGIINDSGIPFSGHTEYLAELTGDTPVMMLACPELRVALATTHLPLSQVSSAVTSASLTRVIRTLHRDLQQRFAIDHPRILVCGLNPHAGEAGHMGREEIDTIEPVLSQLRGEGMLLQGPLPADTLFTPRYLAAADAVLAMYHDQGLPVLKHLGFGRSVNITLGLSIIRTSVDHGTALDLAGSGTAGIGSLQAALESAQQLATADDLRSRERVGS